MSDALQLVRPDLRDFAGYASARRANVSGSVWLNANESPQPSLADAQGVLHRYPEPQPAELRARLAKLYGLDIEQMMVTRGSDEGIDLLVRAFCRAGIDAVLIAPPCFGMYAVSARIQNAPLVEVPLLDVDGTWTLDVAAIIAAVSERQVRLVFLCAPANPTGQALPLATTRALAQALDGRAVLVIDEAYIEYSSQDSACTLLGEFPGLVVLRTLSKAHALAGARIGAVAAAPALIAVLRNLSAPYPVPQPSARVALAALSDLALTEARLRCALAIAERMRVHAALQQSGLVRQVYASDANFLLVRFADSKAAFERLIAAGVVVRDMGAMPGLADALRITIGTREENELLLAALEGTATP